MRKYLVALVAVFILTVLIIPVVINRNNAAEIKASGTLVRIYLHSSGKIITVPVEEYVLGVVAAEMPAEFPAEALKAQAVAARTYVMKRQGPSGVVNPLHPGADVCDEPAHYQGWLSRDQMQERWGKVGFYSNYYKLARAVGTTRGTVITYNGQLIDPVYHSSCGGMGTEGAGSVWKFDVPYLMAVQCPYDADPLPERTMSISFSQLEKVLGVAAVPAGALGSSTFFEVLEKTPTGRPQTVRMGDKIYSALYIRQALGLRSANFSLSASPLGVEATTVGYGHAVGMCQYGAKGMASEGSDYSEIIKHYYTGVELSSLYQGGE